MQATSDPFLGWTTGAYSVAYYVRQLRDMKGSIDPSQLDAGALLVYGELCGAVLARAHARAGDASMLAGYLGGSVEFDDAVAEFARGYSELTVTDHARLAQARAAGELPADGPAGTGARPSPRPVKRRGGDGMRG